MRKELQHFWVDGSYGWNQDWFPDLFMRMGGCAAVTACDSCVYFALRRGKPGLVPFPPVSDHISREDYLLLARQMKPCLHPRMRGIDKLEIYQEGMGRYLQKAGERGLNVGALHGEASYAEAEQRLIEQIDGGYPVPFLTLRHKDASMEFYEWHWYLLLGYDRRADGALAQAVTYSRRQWLDFRKVWDTGFPERGGMILFTLT